MSGCIARTSAPNRVLRFKYPGLSSYLGIAFEAVADIHMLSRYYKYQARGRRASRASLLLLRAGAADGSVRVWDTRELARPLHTFALHVKPTMRMEWSPTHPGATHHHPKVCIESCCYGNVYRGVCALPKGCPYLIVSGEGCGAVAVKQRCSVAAKRHDV